jgi:uncharacterized protein (TIGR03435 family)
MSWRGSGSRYGASLWIGVLAWFTLGARFAPSQVRGAGVGRSPEVTASANASGLSAHELPAYDVVTIKLSAPGGRGADFDTNEDSYIARGATLKMLLEDAYGIRSQLISGITGPLAETRFDLEAKVVDPDAMRKLTDEQRPAMLQQVLEDRFRVKAHVEMKELPLYELVLARGGPKFKQAAKESVDAPEMEIHRRMLDAKAQAMPALANVLTATIGRSVVDKTGLEGNFDFSLRWSPDAEAGADVMAPPGLFAALEDQLGLKLRSAKGPVRTLVVDEAEMPTSN